MENKVVNNQQKSRFEYTEDGHVAVAEYQLKPDVMVLTHTEVPKELGGRGVGGKLAVAALDYARANDLRVIPLCSFMASFIEKHPEYKELVRT
ncbi:MAG: GNAT family N-acetyltransferase [Thermoanaerobaculia bacterium]